MFIPRQRIASPRMRASDLLTGTRLLLTGSTGNIYGSLNAARLARRLERSWDGRYRLPRIASVCP